MSRLLRLRPSPAMVVAAAALFVALGGVSYGVATNSIDSRELKNNSVSSADLRNNTIRTGDLRNNEVRGRDIRNSTIRSADVALNTIVGADVNESSLGKVPSAVSADKATKATDADKAALATDATAVGGVKTAKVAFSAPDGTGFTPILDQGGLIIEAECAAGAALTVRARTTQAGSAMSSHADSSLVVNGDQSFNPGETVPVSAPADATGAGSPVTVVFRGSGGATVSADLYVLGAPNSIPGSPVNDCGVFGTALVG